ncbi:DNA translocase FtsK [Azospirillum baldaniorum]|uniref:DNA translocase FtsK n=1 Tax=Azospirillum baldaniorum TaxID=1064539 RepID=UPI0011A7A1C1|nr:DNA translocase FtsK [Azospirillum baldaniorum]TWA68684.1 DNA translocase FtsK [Azospirillum baldaniorum]
MARPASPRSGSGKSAGARPAGARPEKPPFFSPATRAFVVARARELAGFALGVVGLVLMVILGSYNPADPSWNAVPAANTHIHNLFGRFGAHLADVLIQSLGWAAYLLALVPMMWGWRLSLQKSIRHPLFRSVLAVWGVLLVAMFLAGMGGGGEDPLNGHPGGSFGIVLLDGVSKLLFGGPGNPLVGTVAGVAGGLILFVAMGLSIREWAASLRETAAGLARLGRGARAGVSFMRDKGAEAARNAVHQTGGLLRREPSLATADKKAVAPTLDDTPDEDGAAITLRAAPRGRLSDSISVEPRVEAKTRAVPVVTPPAGGKTKAADQGRPSKQAALNLEEADGYELPPLDLLQIVPTSVRGEKVDEAALRENAVKLEGVLSDFGVRGEVQKVHPGPVVTLYELEPAPGTKSSRVIGLADDIARSMSAVSVRVAVVPGRNVIGIELPNAKRETVLLRELLAGDVFDKTAGKLLLALGKDIGGQSVVADLARFPHLLVAGTTGSGKSVAINTMILSLLYRLPPDRCRFIMIDPKMLELSVYEGIPHLLTPVVTDPKKAVVALKWTVREMEDRYRNMSKLGVRNIEGYNARLREARADGELLTRRVQTGFDPDTGKPIFEEQPLDLKELPYIVVIVDEMADLMLVAGKDIEAAIQRLAQMARAAGIHLIMATQRPSVDVITGTIKANFPTRISFQVTSKIDSRTILGEQGAEQLLGQGDMLYMAGGGRITRVHGPFVADGEVEQVVKFLKTQGEPSYVDAITEEDDEDGGSFDDGSGAGGGSGDDLYDKAVAVVCRERKASTSFIQRQLRIGYNSAARLIERMETEGVVSKPNHAGKREVLARNIEE